jgi:hypothetical protein
MHLGKLCFALLAFGTFAVGCSSSKSTSNDSRDNDERSTGGTSASGGTTNQGGTAGAAPTGGTGTASSSCANICQLSAECEGIVDPFCPQLCAQGEDDAMGCLADHRSLVDCIARLGPCTATASDCPTELAALERCKGRDGSADCAPPGTGPANADCIAVCEKLQSCPGGVPSNCAQSCGDGAAEASVSGCTEPYQRLLGCMDTCTDPCNYASSVDCATEQAEYMNCIVCSSNPSSPECSGP